MKEEVTVHRKVRQSSNVVQEFSRFAHQYDKYNMIQAMVAKQLVENLSSLSYSNVLDIGCGSGEVFKNFEKQRITVEKFIALDSATTMLDIHPSNTSISKICVNFNDHNFLEQLPDKKVDMVISSSSLQWSTDLDYTIDKLSKLSTTFNAALFTSGTFKTLHEQAGVISPIYSAETIQQIMMKYYGSVNFTLHHYSLNFETTREMFRYIKQSGVSSGERKLGYKETKRLMNSYPLDYLEFEVLFIEAKH